ncbi:MAG TPA: hypothetical protein VNO22_05970 [Planctomycetota bacterium]|nr:hypothetical protein [Planctomycetota bacterium]
MRKFTSILVPGFVLALAATAAAQEKPVTTTKDMTDTVKVTVQGNVVLDYVWRGRELAAFKAPYGPEDTNSFEGEIGLRFNVDLSDKVSAVVEFGKERVDDIGPGPGGSGGQVLPFLGDDQTDFQTIVLRELHVNIAEFLDPSLRLQVGITTWSFDVRGRGSSFAFDPRHSQEFARNVSNVEDGAGSLAVRGVADELDPVGGWLQYKRDALLVDVVFLPMVVEGGEPQQDEALYAVDFFYNLDDKGSRVGAILALSTFGDTPLVSGSDTSIFTLGGGATLRNLVPNLELYGEVYFQFGNAGTIGGDSIDAGGIAFQVGALYQLEGDLAPWVGANITWISGDGDDDPTDDEVGNFLSYENVNDLLILEDMYFGYDWDTNYFAIKLSGGLALSVGGGKNNLELSAILGITRTVEDVQFASGGEDGLGNELDVKARWILTKQASLHGAIAFLFSSDVVEQSMEDLGISNPDDGAILYTIGADLRF